MASFSDVQIKTVVKDGEIYVSVRDILGSMANTFESNVKKIIENAGSFGFEDSIFAAGSLDGMEYVYRLVLNSFVDEEFQNLTKQI